jgi:hypothetical protein
LDHPKYVIVSENGNELAIVFSATLSHKQMAGRSKVVAAGFLSLAGGTVTTWGKSESLETMQRGHLAMGGKSTVEGFQSRPQDEEVIRRSLNLLQLAKS